jgi:hypothetical protein
VDNDSGLADRIPVSDTIFTQLKIITTHRISLIKEKEHPSSRIHFRPFPTEMKAIFQGNKRALFGGISFFKKKNGRVLASIETL